MGKVITVWGSPGSGKSMFCCILAKALTRDNPCRSSLLRRPRGTVSSFSE